MHIDERIVRIRSHSSESCRLFFSQVFMFFFSFLKQQTERVRAADEVPAEQRRNHPSPPHGPRGDETNQLPDPRYARANHPELSSLHLRVYF